MTEPDPIAQAAPSGRKRRTADDWPTHRAKRRHRRKKPTQAKR